MKLLYNVEPLVTILGGIILSFILWIFVRPPNLKSKKIIPPAACIIIMLLLVGGGHYARKTYTYVPQIYWGEESLSSVRAKLETAGLICLDKNVATDSLAKMQLDNGKDINDNSFKVMSIDCDFDAFLEQGTAINLSITWSDSFHNPSLTWQGGEEFNPQEYYGNVIIDNLYGHNSDEIVISTALAGLKSNNMEYYTPQIGVYPGYKKYIIVEVELIDYFNPQRTWRKVAYIGDQVYFSNVTDGIYYYVVYASGYKISFPSTLIKIEQQETITEFAVAWDANLERVGDTYSDPFYIRIEDSGGHAQSNVNVSLFVKSNIDGEPTQFGSYSLVSNEEGLLTCSNKVIDFQLFDNCYFQLFLEEDRGNGYIVQEPNNDGIAKCIIPDL